MIYTKSSVRVSNGGLYAIVEGEEGRTSQINALYCSYLRTFPSY